MESTTVKTQIIFLLLLVASVSLHAQPINDDPCGAIELTLTNGPGCIPSEPISWDDATATPGIPNPTCASYSTGDVWFKFILNEPADIFITTIEGNGGTGIEDGGMQLFTVYGTCDGPLYTYICDDDGGNSHMPQISIRAQAAGTYYIRFWDYEDATSGNLGGICVAANPFPVMASNDDPCNALEIEVNGNENCTPSSPISWLKASGTSGLGIPSCGSYRTGDIWFKFTLVDTSDIYITTLAGSAPGGILDGALSLYQVDQCNSEFIELECANNDGSNLMPQVSNLARFPGQYYIRFWDTKDSLSGNIDGICVAAQPSVIIPVVNDDPCDAIALLVSQDTSCIPDNPLTWTNATATNIPTDLVCGSYQTGDIWFTFTLTEMSDLFITTLPGIGPGSITDGAMALYLADTCDGGMTFAFCDDDSGIDRMPQIKEKTIPAGTYYIRFWDYDDNLSGNIGGICVAATTSASNNPNDNCFTGIVFPDIPLDGSCSSVLINTQGATGDSLYLCGNTSDSDVWLSFIAPVGVSAIAFKITENGNPKPAIMRLHRGSCERLQLENCFTESEGYFTDLIEGKVYTIKTQTIEQGVVGQYEICLSAILAVPNDDACGAITLIPEHGVDTCKSPGPISWEFATPSASIPDPPCGNYTGGDVWFKFELTELSDIVIQTFEGTGNHPIDDGAMALYRASDDCSSLIFLGCQDDVDALNLMPVYQDFAVQTGTYYIRFWQFSGDPTGDIDGICIATKPSISTASNDQCSGAIAFPPIPIDGTCSSVLVNNEGSTGSINASVPGFNDDDLWYSFIVPDGINRLVYEIKTLHGNNQHIVCITTSCDVGSFSDCFSQEIAVLEGLISGQTYYMRVYTGEQNVPSEYNVCLHTPPPPPSHDECEGAIPFPAIPADGSCVSMHVNTTWATSSGFFSCGDGQNDVWYSFTMPGDKEDIIVEITTIGRYIREQFEVFSGPCDSLQSIFCLNDYQFESAQVHNLTPGETYYLRSFTDDYRLFEWDLCLHTPKTPPANDECPQAIPFPPLPLDGSCATVLVNTTGATGDNSESCAEVYDDDVWYTFFLPDGYTGIIIDNTPLTEYTTAGVGIYGGTCDNLNLIGCYAYNESRVIGLTGGQTYYARTHTAFPNKEGTYELCFRLLPPPPANDSCIHATAYPEIPLTGDWVGLEINTIAATGDGLPSCEGYADDDLWYSFVVPDGVENITYRFNWDPYISIELFSGKCDSLEFIKCYGVNKDGAFRNLVAGDTYYLRVYNVDEYYFSTIYLELHVPAPLVNDECPGRIVFPPIPLDGSCSTISGNTLNATGSNVVGYCNGDFPTSEVWFEFTAPQDRTSVKLYVQIESGSGMNFQLLEGTCDSLISRGCLFLPDLEDLSGLIPGATYYLQGIPLSPAIANEYTLCLSVIPLPPFNDHCDNPTSITGDPGVFVDPGPQTTIGATDSPLDICYPSNQFENTYDVWYTFLTDEDGGDATVIIRFQDPYNHIPFSFVNLHGQALAGDCNDFTTLSCVSNDFTVDSYEDSIVVLNMYSLDPLTTYYFRVYPTGSSGNYAEIDFTVFAEGSALDPMTGLDDQPAGKTESLEIEKVYPSPATSIVHVEFTSSHDSDVTLMLTDLLGHIVYHQTQFARDGENHFSIQTSAFPPGIYFIVLEKNGMPSEVKRVVIQ